MGVRDESSPQFARLSPHRKACGEKVRAPSERGRPARKAALARVELILAFPPIS